MSEEFAFEEVAVEGGALHGHEGPLCARGEGVERVRDELLARAARALDQHRGLRGRGLADEAEDLLHRVGRARDVLKAVLDVEFAAERHDLLLQRTRLQGLRDAQVELVEVDRLREEVVRAVLHRLHGEVHGAERREEDAGEVRAHFLRGLEELDAVRPGHAHV